MDTSVDQYVFLYIYFYLLRRNYSLVAGNPTPDMAAAIYSIYNAFYSSSFNNPALPLRVCLDDYLNFYITYGPSAT